MDARLIINGVETKLGFKELEYICDGLDDCSRNVRIFEELAKSPSVYVRTSIASRKRLNEETIRILIKDTSVEVIQYILNKAEVLMELNFNELSRYIDMGNLDILNAIVEEIDSITEEFCICDKSTLLHILLDQKDPNVLYSLAQLEELPDEFLDRLANHDDITISTAAKRTIRKKELYFQNVDDQDDEYDDEEDDGDILF